jgi:hypothetical protein
MKQLDELEKGQTRLYDFLNKDKERDIDIEMVNQKVNFVKRLIKSKQCTSAIEQSILEKVQTNDVEWISQNILRNPVPKKTD